MTGYGTAETAKEMLDRWYSLRQEWEDMPPQKWEVENVASRGTVSINLFTGDHYDLPSALEDVIDMLCSLLEDIPEDLRSSATFEIEGGEYSTDISVSYERPETDDEWNTRRADIERRQALHAERQERADREAYERLKAKFKG